MILIKASRSKACEDPGERVMMGISPGFGKKHQAMYLTWKEEKKTKALYIPVAYKKEAEIWSANYKKLKKQIKDFCDFYKTLLKTK
jgi:hypothetical protein